MIRFSLLMFILSFSGLSASEFFGKAQMVEGDVDYIRLFKSYSAKPKMDFLDKDQVVTQKLSKLLIRLFKGSDLFIDENTEMVLTRNDAEEVIHLELLTGTMQGTMKDLKGHRLEIFTKVGSVQVVGTEFIVSYEPALGKGLDVQVLEGEVKVTLEGIQGPMKPTFKVGERRRFQVGGPGDQVKQEPAQEGALKKMREVRALIQRFDDGEGEESDEEDEDRHRRRSRRGEGADERDENDEGEEEEDREGKGPKQPRQNPPGLNNSESDENENEEDDESEGGARRPSPPPPWGTNPEEGEEGEEDEGEDDSRGPAPLEPRFPDLDGEEEGEDSDEDGPMDDGPGPNEDGPMGDGPGPNEDGPMDDGPGPNEDSPMGDGHFGEEPDFPEELDEIFNDDVLEILKDEVLKELKINFTLGD